MQHDSADGDELPLFFYLPWEAHGEFCQWFSCIFTVKRTEIASLVGDGLDESELATDQDKDGSTRDTSEDRITFNCAEQFMMYCKAGRFHDAANQRRIMATDSPKEQKRLGKQVIGFWDARWDEVKSEVVVAGNMARFGQNDKLRRKLLATGDRLLVEAASRDRIWGIGFSAKHAMSHRQHWGENRLGKALMAVRERLREQEGDGEGDKS